MTSPTTFPEPPDVGGIQLGHGQSRLRFEDIAEDGRLRLEGVWPAIGPILWGKMEVASALLRLGADGVRAVLTYVALEGGRDPISVRALAEHEVRWQLGRTVDASGNTTRFTLDTWLVSDGPRGVAGNPGANPASEERVRMARAYGQHVFTRPAAPKGQHRVTSLGDPLFDGLAAPTVVLREPALLLELPAGATLLEAAPHLDPTPIVFGLCHTDGNQHVNFLAYPRLAEEAALRRLAEIGADTRVLARTAAVAYRKPCFAGQTVRLVIQAFEEQGAPGAVVVFLPADQASAPPTLADVERPLAVVRLGFGG
jgi:hypothetical protein